MSMTDGELDFQEDAEVAAENVCRAIEKLTEVKAYVLSAEEMESFKDAQMALRELHQGFEPHHDCEDVR